MKKQVEDLLYTKNDLANALSLMTEEKNQIGENNEKLKAKCQETALELAEMNQRNKVVYI